MAVNRDTRRCPSVLRCTLALLLLGALAGAAGANAAPSPWSAPRTLYASSAQLSTFDLHAGFGSAGGLASWTVEEVKASPADERLGLLGAPLAAGGFGAARAIVPLRPSYDATRDLTLSHDLRAVPFGAGGVATAGLVRSGSIYRLGVALAPGTAHPGRLRTVGPRGAVALGEGGYALAGDARGDVAVLFQAGNHQRRRIYLMVRRPGGQLSRPRAINRAPGRARSLDVALDGHGGVVMVWGRAVTGAHPGFSLITRELDRRGRLSAPRRLTRVATNLAAVHAAVGPTGARVVSWMLQTCDQTSGCQLPPTLRAATGTTSGFAPPVTLQAPPASGDLELLTVGTAVAADGTALVAWVNDAGGATGVHLARAPAGGAFAITSVAPTGSSAALGGVASAADGRVGLIWENDVAVDAHHTTAQIRAAVAPSGAGPFGAPEVVADESRDRAAVLQPPALAFDPSSSRALVVWAGNGTVRAGTRGP